MGTFRWMDLWGLALDTDKLIDGDWFTYLAWISLLHREQDKRCASTAFTEAPPLAITDTDRIHHRKPSSSLHPIHPHYHSHPRPPRQVYPEVTKDHLIYFLGVLVVMRINWRSLQIEAWEGSSRTWLGFKVLSWLPWGWNLDSYKREIYCSHVACLWRLSSTPSPPGACGTLPKAWNLFHHS